MYLLCMNWTNHEEYFVAYNRCAKLGRNRRCSFDNKQVLIVCQLGL